MPKPVEPVVSATAPTPDPRPNLKPGRWDAEQAGWNMRMLSTTPPKGRTLGATHSDLAFSGNLVIQGNYNGFDIYDVTNPSKPVPEADLPVPRVAERRVGVPQPALHVVGSDQQP